MFEPKLLKEYDNKATFIIGYRNLYNLVVLFISAMYIAMGSQSEIQSFTGIVIFVLGCKWFLTQCRENIDAMYINEMTK